MWWFYYVLCSHKSLYFINKIESHTVLMNLSVNYELCGWGVLINTIFSMTPEKRLHKYCINITKSLINANVNLWKEVFTRCFSLPSFSEGWNTSAVRKESLSMQSPCLRPLQLLVSEHADIAYWCKRHTLGDNTSEQLSESS